MVVVLSYDGWKKNLARIRFDLGMFICGFRFHTTKFGLLRKSGSQGMTVFGPIDPPDTRGLLD